MTRFFDFLFPPRADEAILRDVSPDEFLALLVPCVVPATHPDIVALLPFPDLHVRAAIHEAKYHGSQKAFELLGIVLAEYLRDSDEGFRKPLIVPVPLGKERRLERGFNQVEEIVRCALRSLSEEGLCPFVFESHLLERIRETESQVSLERHRRATNMHGAFKATHPADSARTYILIDDVITTGATLGAAIHALTAAGATHIIPLALAH